MKPISQRGIVQMIKGWRNDPRWVEIYRQKKKDEFQNNLERMKAQYAIDASSARLEQQMRMLERGSLKVSE